MMHIMTLPIFKAADNCQRCSCIDCYVFSLSLYHTASVKDIQVTYKKDTRKTQKDLLEEHFLKKKCFFSPQHFIEFYFLVVIALVMRLQYTNYAHVGA
mmetsp:Transcript_36637/g.44239  ORF Transcript_36637/g.44239 Transcript_36637/m.44239 type:complete len:98 (+) Transcript_36637:751-1044(+)